MPMLLLLPGLPDLPTRLQSTPKLVLTDQLKGEHQYRESLWQLLTGDSTLRTVRSEMVRSEACSQNDSAYVAPMKPWILNLLDRSLIFRTHTLDDNPDLVSSLMFVSAVLHLFVTHTDVADGSGDSEDMAETAEEREAGRKQPLAMQHAAALVLQLAQQDPDGPWGLNIPVTVMMNVFPAIIKCINVFAPVRLLMAFNITVRQQSHMPAGCLLMLLFSLVKSLNCVCLRLSGAGISCTRSTLRKNWVNSLTQVFVSQDFIQLQCNTSTFWVYDPVYG